MTELPRFVVPGTLRVPATSSTVAMYATLRQALLEYTSPSGEQLTDLIGDPPRLYVRAQPEPVVFPYVTLLLSRTSLAAYNGYRETVSFEVQAMGRPDIQLPTVESAMDLVDQCLTGLTYASDGLMVSRSRSRQTVPQFTTPADQNVVGVIATYTLYAWPRVLTSRAVP